MVLGLALFHHEVGEMRVRMYHHDGRDDNDFDFFLQLKNAHCVSDYCSTFKSANSLPEGKNK